MRVVYQGEPGANSHIAVRTVFGDDAEAVPCASFDECFAQLDAGAADRGMIPIENTLAGRVADIHHLLPRSSFRIVAEHFMPIRFQLMGLPGATLAGIRSVESHVHALGQCRRIIAERHWRAVVAGDTAGAARQVSEAGDPTRAALAPRLAAEIYGLDILAENVEDAENNTTRFVVLAREPEVPTPGSGPVMTSFVFRVRNIPAALYKALGGFATNGVNMTKLESYQLDGHFTATQFLADIEGHPDEPGVGRALEELMFFAADFRIIGVYPAGAFRAEFHERLRAASPAAAAA